MSKVSGGGEELGTAKFGWFNALKASARNFRFTLSETNGKVLARPKFWL
jgi:hypothetical protein